MHVRKLRLRALDLVRGGCDKVMHFICYCSVHSLQESLMGQKGEGAHASKKQKTQESCKQTEN